MKLKKFATVGL